MGASCCSTKQALQRGEVNDLMGIQSFYDRKINSIVGDKNFFAFAPGSLQMLTYNKYGWSGARQIDDDSHKLGTLTSPFSGLTFDYYAELNCEKWDFYLGLSYDFVVAPDDMFGPSDRMNGVNMFNKFVLQETVSA